MAAIAAGVIAVTATFILVKSTHGNLKATRAAWNAIQNADNTVRESAPAMSSEYWQQVSFLYSQIDLDDVDPELQRYVMDTVSVAKRMGNLLSMLEAEYDRLHGGVNALSNFGAFLGAAGSDGNAPQSDAALGAFLFGLAGTAVAEAQWKEVLEAHSAEIESLETELDHLDDTRRGLARVLTERYGVPFADPFSQE